MVNILSSFGFGLHAAVSLHLRLTNAIGSGPRDGGAQHNIPEVVVVVDVEMETKTNK